MAIVNNTIISKRDFIKNYQAAAVYYRNALKTYAGKEIKGKITKEHGSNGCVRVLFERGMPGQSIGTKLDIL